MIGIFKFRLPLAVTEQLIEKIAEGEPSPFNEENLKKLRAFQTKEDTHPGVYMIFLDGAAVYVGKADDVHDRLRQHHRKLMSRQNIDMNRFGFKALVLDENWSTSANEDMLIAAFQAKGLCSWNGGGFGPKDPGKNRDDSETSEFDNQFPIRHDWPVDGVPDQIVVGELLKTLKAKLPFLLRYEKKIPKELEDKVVNLAGVDRTSQVLALEATKALGSGWQLMRFNSHMTIYKSDKRYANGTQLYP